MLEVIELFPMDITEEMNKYLTKYITREEIHQVLQSFQKGKSSIPDGFTLEFFLGFYDKIKEDILAVVQEYIRVGKVLGSMNATFIALIH